MLRAESKLCDEEKKVGSELKVDGRAAVAHQHPPIQCGTRRIVGVNKFATARVSVLRLGVATRVCDYDVDYDFLISFPIVIDS